jgi:hypothetical protein
MKKIPDVHIMKCLTGLVLLFISLSGAAQIRVSGKVYDISKYRPLEAVSVMTTSGYGTVSDSLGHFTIIARETDSIWFSYLNKPTPKYPVRTILNPANFEISLHVNATELKEVKIMPRNYRLDSIQNRQDYAKAFNFQKPGLGTSLNLSPGGGAGLDIGELIRMFQFRRNKRMLAFQDRLLQEEEDKYIDHRFNRALVIKLTQLRGDALNNFMKIYRPTVEFVESSSDYEFQDYIKKCFSHYQRYQNLRNQLEGK